MGAIAGAALGAAGQIAGSLGGSDRDVKSAPSSGFATYPGEVRDYALGSIFPQIQAYNERGFQSYPVRRINEADKDPIFGSPARQDLQKYHDLKALAENTQNGQQRPQDQETALNALNAYRNEMLAREYLKSFSNAHGGVVIDQYDNDTLAKMGGMLRRGGYSGGPIPFHGVNFQPDDSLEFHKLVTAPLRGV